MAAGPANGGGIFNNGTLALANCTLSGNSVQGGNGGNAGASAGGRSAPGGAGGAAEGGGIWNAGLGTLNVTNCTFSGNSVNGGQGGAGFANNCGGEGGNGFGGAVGIDSGVVALVNSTVSDNSASGGDGGAGGFRYLTDPLCPGCPCVPSAGSSVGGIFNRIGQANIRSALIAVNGPRDFAGAVASRGHNLIGITNGSDGWVSSDLTGSGTVPLNPKIGPLKDNGGPTFTMALLLDSPALDRGASNGLIGDQRGRLRPIDNPAITNSNNADGTDIGAFELQTQPITLGVSMKNATNLVVSFDTEVGQRYRIESKDALLNTGLWKTVADNILGTGAAIVVTDPDAAVQPHRFYRAQTLP